MTTAAKLKIFLAGRVALEGDGAVLDERRFPGRQGRLLFAYLMAEEGRPVPRDELADALWGETPPATSDKALAVLASNLRGLLAEGGIDGGKALTSAFGSYRLDLPDGTWVDIIAAADALREAEAAVPTCTGRISSRSGSATTGTTPCAEPCSVSCGSGRRARPRRAQRARSEQRVRLPSCPLDAEAAQRASSGTRSRMRRDRSGSG
jgi:hypothetical protein